MEKGNPINDKLKETIQGIEENNSKSSYDVSYPFPTNNFDLTCSHTYKSMTYINAVIHYQMNECKISVK